MIILIVKIRYWLARRICRRYAREYLRAVDNHGLEWTLALIEEDQDLYGDPFNHALARAGVIDYAQRAGEAGELRAHSVPCQFRQPVQRQLLRRLR